MTLETGGKGIKHGGEGTAATWEDGQAKIVANDGLMWVKTADADVLIVDEDSGNDLGERKFALMLDPEIMDLTEASKAQSLTEFIIPGNGGWRRKPLSVPLLQKRLELSVQNLRQALLGIDSSEFSGTWNISALSCPQKQWKAALCSKAEAVGLGTTGQHAEPSMAHFRSARPPC